MALALDGHATGGVSNLTSFTVSLTTTNATDVIIANVTMFASPATIAVSSLNSTNLPSSGWTRRIQRQNSGSESEEEWWTKSSQTLSAESITVTLNASGFANASIFGVSGANTTSPFDPNLTSPVSGTLGSLTVTGVTTTNANDFLFELGGDDGGGAVTAGAIGGTTATIIDDVNANPQDCYTEFRIVSATQSSISYAFTGTPGGTPNCFADAIQQASAAAGEVPRGFRKKPKRVNLYVISARRSTKSKKWGRTPRVGVTSRRVPTSLIRK